MIDLLQTQPPGGPAGGLIQFLPMIFIFVIFFMISLVSGMSVLVARFAGAGDED